MNIDPPIPFDPGEALALFAEPEQELYGFLLVHHAIRDMMHQAAHAGDHDPDRISFTRSLRVIRRQVRLMHDRGIWVRPAR